MPNRRVKRAAHTILRITNNYLLKRPRPHRYIKDALWLIRSKQDMDVGISLEQFETGIGEAARA